ncbi:serine/arginine repetitive matrix protein 1 isoform X2 [Maniola jurtina]|uniref:serine/arginine repetitive matrix protein 1 isoform X2 n=1 Tax=Maniola jurtina TaxID=191418 RepID=UPI001E687654|nr:serine/arginine repetitive matrix protein 1 isoform X2 [Maniola jurtina]
MPSNKKLMTKMRQLAQWILVVHVVEFIEAYCTPRDTARRSPQRNRRSREPRRSPESSRWRYESRRQNYDFESRRPYEYESRRYFGREYDADSGRKPAFDAESARRRADYESARRTDFDLSVPEVSRRSPESAPEGSAESPPEPAPSAPLRQERQPRHRSQPYYESESSSEDRSSSTEGEEDEFGEFDPFATAPSLHSPDSGRSDPRYANAPRRNPSPYYYGDLFKTAPPPPAPSAPTVSSTSSSRGPRYRKSASLDAPHVAPRPNLPKRFSVAEDGFRELERSSSSSGESAWMPPRRRGRDAAGCACAAPEDVEEHRASRSVFYVPAPLPRWPQEMTTRQIYETAFDCKIARSDDDLDDFDRVSNHPALLQAEERKTFSSASSAFEAVERSEPDYKGRRKVTMKTDSVRRSKIPTIRQKKENETNTAALSEELEKVHIEEEDRTSTSQLPLRGYTPSPPSTAPLPTKFQQKDGSAMNSIKSAPNLPQTQPAHPRLKDLRLPVKSLRARDTPTSSDASMTDVKASVSTELDVGPRLRDSSRESRDGDDERAQSKDGIFLEIKGRPTSDSDTPEMNRYKGPKGVGPIMEFKGRPGVARPRRKYSSTESMATSSSGGSMESLRSSNSEGDRSSSSSESRHSSSLSSHSSDSGNVPFIKSHHMQLSGFGHHPTKLHILSPISDKSSQEPASETSDNNKNNNSQKVSPEDVETGNTTIQTTVEILPKPKRRALQNRNLLNLTFRHSTPGDTEIQGSDSGISIHSREGVDSRNAFINFKNSNTEEERKDDNVDLSDLPFDMPKLRRRRAEAEVDLRTLPFDMPKLRRKLRGQSLQLNNDFGEAISNASSSQSVQDLNQGKKHREKLTLNFDGGNTGSSTAKGLHLNLGPIAPPRDLVDASLPLDRQGWYHGTLTRLEAEDLLRDAEEGAFLVRNSESAKHDYSLSLKSTRGFMHMRICRGVDGYTLGGAATAFPTVPALMRHYVTAQRLPVRGAEHMALSTPLPAVML